MSWYSDNKEQLGREQQPDADLVRLTAELETARQALDEARKELEGVAVWCETAWSGIYHFGDPNYGYDGTEDPADLEEYWPHVVEDIGKSVRKWLAAHENAARGATPPAGVENGVAGQETREKGD